MKRKQSYYLIRINGKLVEYKDAFELQQILLKHKNESGEVLDLGKRRSRNLFRIPNQTPDGHLLHFLHGHRLQLDVC